jgi:hypothetical protein
MSYRGKPNWAPVWVWRRGPKKKEIPPRTEIGVLRQVRRSRVKPEALFLIIEHEANEYMGCLLFDNRGSCRWIHSVLRQHRGYRIEDIGSLDVSRLPYDMKMERP